MLEDQEQKKKQQQMRCIYREGLARNDHPISRAATQWRTKCRAPEGAGNQSELVCDLIPEVVNRHTLKIIRHFD